MQEIAFIPEFMTIKTADFVIFLVCAFCVGAALVCFKWIRHEEGCGMNNILAGLRGTGSDVEFDIIGETEKAYRIKSDDGFSCWMPKLAFDDSGCLRDEYHQMLRQKRYHGRYKLYN